MQFAGIAIATILALIAAYCIAFNYHASTTRRRSFIPLVGGMAGAIACLLYPHMARYAWVPLVVDPGCVFYFALAAVCLFCGPIGGNKR